MIDTVKTIWQGLDWSALWGLFRMVIPALLCITFHELSHGFIAYKLGDNTAKNAGRLTLNPIKHIDILGLIMMVIFKFGWAKPVPVNMYKFKDPKRDMAITALAGPLSNIVLAIVIMLIYGFVYQPLLNAGKTGQAILEMLTITAYLSCALAVFNIIPIPPLDGSKVLFSLLPQKGYDTLMRYERFGFIILLALIWVDAFTPFLSKSTQALFTWLFRVSEWSYSLIM